MIYLDPRLSRQLQDIEPEQWIDAIMILDVAETVDFDTLIQSILSPIHEQPTLLRLIPRANAIAITASPEMIQELLNHSAIQIASSSAIDLIFF